MSDIEKLAKKWCSSSLRKHYSFSLGQLEKLIEAYHAEQQRQEQEPLAYIHRNEYDEYRLEPMDSFKIKSIPRNVDIHLFTTPPDQSKLIESQASEIAELKEKITTELKRGGSYKTLVASLEGQLEHYRAQDYSLAKHRLDTLENTLNSEKEMNETLTNENTALQSHINELREALETISDTLDIHTVNQIADATLASTPSQSLQAHDDEVIERCAVIAEDGADSASSYQAVEAIRALKGTS